MISLAVFTNLQSYISLSISEREYPYKHPITFAPAEMPALRSFWWSPRNTVCLGLTPSFLHASNIPSGSGFETLTSSGQ